MAPIDLNPTPVQGPARIQARWEGNQKPVLPTAQQLSEERTGALLGTFVSAPGSRLTASGIFPGFTMPLAAAPSAPELFVAFRFFNHRRIGLS
jgi:hypothetical protein